MQFGGAQIGRLTKSVAGRSSGDMITLADIVEQFQSVIKAAARVKLIKSFAAKNKVEAFSSRQHIHGLLELIILLVIKLKYKENVDFDKSRFTAELEEVVEWMVSDEETMNGKAWTVEEFAHRFDEWISRLALE